MPDLASLGGLVSAQIIILPPDGPLPIKFLLNPRDLTIEQTANWEPVQQPAADGGLILQFNGNSPRTTSVEMVFDTFLGTLSGNLMPPSAAVKLLNTAMNVSPILKAQGTPRPPYVSFGWGGSMIFTEAVVTSVSDTYARQFPGGIRTRSSCKVGLTEVPPVLPGTNPTSGGLTPRHTHAMIEGDSLASVAHRHYGDPNKWRALAVANGIDDPMRVRPGTTLLIPDRRDLESLV